MDENTWQAAQITNNKNRMGMSDLTINSLHIEDDEETVYHILGNRNSSRIKKQDEFYTAKILTYDFGEVYLTELNENEERFIDSIFITSPEINCPRDIKVGDSAEKVIASYYNQCETLSKYEITLYRYNEDSDTDDHVPPAGFVWIYKGETRIHYWVMVKPEELDGLTMEEMEGSYFYLKKGYIKYMISDGKVIKIEMGIHAHPN